MSKNNEKSVNVLNEKELNTIAGGSNAASKSTNPGMVPQWQASGFKSRKDFERRYFGKR